MGRREEEILIHGLTCVDPTVGEHILHGYLAEALPNEQKQRFEDHLPLCLKCQEDLKYVRWVLQQLGSSEGKTGTKVNKLQPVLAQSDETSQDLAAFFLEEYIDEALPVTLVYNRDNPNLTHDYYGKPLMDKLAASTKASGELTFPITVEYAGGHVIGQFWKRVGHLFFRLVKSTAEPERFSYGLVYTSASDPSDTRVFELQVRGDKRIGGFREFVKSNTIQEMLKVMRQFKLFLKRKE